MAGRVFVITGASGALGSAVALAVSGQGHRVALIDHATHTPHGLVDGERCMILGGVDLTDAGSATAAIEAVAARFGVIDVVLNIAGAFSWETVEGGDPETWRKLFRLNLETCANVCRAAIPHLKASKAGRIVNVGANGALKAASGMGAYAASKASVHRLTEALAEELKGHGVTVNAVLPSILDTPTNRADMPKSDFATWVTTDELAAVMLFLAGEKAGAVTGALIPVTGRV